MRIQGNSGGTYESPFSVFGRVKRGVSGERERGERQKKRERKRKKESTHERVREKARESEEGV